MTVEAETGRKRRRATAPTTPDPVEIAMEAAASGQLPGEEALSVLRANADLMRQQLSLARNEMFRNRIKAVRDAALAVGAVLLVVGMSAFVWSASQARGLVIEAFSVPPDLAAQGLTGEVVAARLKGRLAELQDRTVSTRAAETFAEDWSEDIAVEIPSTGVALGDVRRWLSRTVGRQTVVTGAVWRTPEGLKTSVSATRHGVGETGPTADVDAALTAAAEDLYRRTQPYRYAVYLLQNEREAERAAHASAYLASAAPEERPWAYLHMAITEPDRREARELFRRAIELNPELMLAHQNFAAHLSRTGLSEEALREYTAAERALRRRNTGGARPELIATTSAAHRYAIALLRRDFASASSALEARAAEAEFNDSHEGLNAFRATLLAGLHRYTDADRAVSSFPTDLEANRAAGRGATYVMPNAFLARMRGDWMRAYNQLSALAAADTGELAGDRPIRRKWLDDARDVALTAPLAEAAAELGRIEEARALIGPTARDCYPCLIVRGRVADRAGAFPDADRWYAEALRQAPSLPQAEFEWGMDRLKRGDAAGALALFRSAQRKGPRWADPIKGEADALVRLGRTREALRRYEAAADRAPSWGALHLAWGRALEAQGKRDQARQKYTEAVRMDLSAADRAEVVRRLGAA